eukprot:tig00000317_g24032.t1
MGSSGSTSRDAGAYAGGTHVLDLSDDLISAVFQHLDPKREGLSVPRVCRRFAVAWRAARFASLELAAPSLGVVHHVLRPSSAGVRAALSELQQLRVSRFPCSSLGDVRGLPFLRRLHLDGLRPELQQGELDGLARLSSELPSLEELQLSGELPVVPEEGPLAERVAASVRALLAGLRRDRIRALDLVGWPMDAEHVAALGELTRLEALKFSPSQRLLGDPAGLRLASLAPLERLAALRIEPDTVDYKRPRGHRELAPLGGFRRLRSLEIYDLWAESSPEEPLQFLRDLAPSLRRLEISCSVRGDASGGLAELGDLSSLRSLRVRLLSSTHSADVAPQIARLTGLEELSLSNFERLPPEICGALRGVRSLEMSLGLLGISQETFDGIVGQLEAHFPRLTDLRWSLDVFLDISVASLARLAARGLQHARLRVFDGRVLGEEQLRKRCPQLALEVVRGDWRPCEPSDVDFHS